MTRTMEEKGEPTPVCLLEAREAEGREQTNSAPLLFVQRAAVRKQMLPVWMSDL